MTDAAGLEGRGFATGAAPADYDNDGDPVLFVAAGHPFAPVSRVWPEVRYTDPPLFMDVASIINSYSLSGSVSGGASLQKAPSTDSFSLGAAGSRSNTPTVTYQPLMGDRFTRSLLQPIPPAAVFQLLQGGLPPELVLRTTVRSVNGLRGDALGVPGDPGFRELTQILSRLQRGNGLGTRIEG